MVTIRYCPKILISAGLDYRTIGQEVLKHCIGVEDTQVVRKEDGIFGKTCLRCPQLYV